MAGPHTPCDHCGIAPGDVYDVDSEKGLEAWNRLHPDDQRTKLWFCSLSCTFIAGYQLGLSDVY